MRIAVVALGKIGLPLAVQYADKGHEVIGVDVNPAVVEAVNAGTEPFPGEAHLAEKLAALSPATGNGALRATTDYAEAIPEADAIVLVVPLFVNDATWEPDFAWMDDATRSLAAHLTPNTLISYETTLPVGTLRGRFKPMIEEISGLKEGTDFHLVFSPERVLTGRVFADLRRYPKLVGGLDEAGTQAGIAFYESVLDFDERDDLPRPNGVWDMGTAEAAEMAKLAETTYRDVNIGLANQFAVYADKAGFDVERVIEACNSQPYSHIHRPGIAVGGHCIPVYPRLYLSPTPTPPWCAPPAPSTPPCPPTWWVGPPRCSARSRDCASSCWGPLTAARSRRPPSPGSSPPWRPCARPAPRSSSTTPCTPTRSWPASAGPPTTWGSRSTSPSSRPTTPSTASSPPPTCPGCASCWTGAAPPTPPSGPVCRA